MAASNGDASQVQEVKDEEPSQPPTPSSQTVSTGSLKSIMKRFLQHFPLLLGLYMVCFFNDVYQLTQGVRETYEVLFFG